jgi:hypothetical protein
MNIDNYIAGGKLGDFLHFMYAVKRLSQIRNTKANIYLCDLGWELGVETAQRELSEVLSYQNYVNSVQILTEYELDPIQTPQQNTPIQIFNKEILERGFTDMGHYIRSPWLYKACWTELYSRTYDFPITDEYHWITYPKVRKDLTNKVLIHRRSKTAARVNTTFPYEMILEEYGNNVMFIASSDSDYEQFDYKDKVPFLKVSTLDDWFTAINSCSMMISNLSSPAVMAHAMDKLRIIELPYTADANHCIGEEKYSKNVYWYLDNQINNLRVLQ